MISPQRRQIMIHGKRCCRNQILWKCWTSHKLDCYHAFIQSRLAQQFFLFSFVFFFYFLAINRDYRWSVGVCLHGCSSFTTICSNPDSCCRISIHLNAFSFRCSASDCSCSWKANRRYVIFFFYIFILLFYCWISSFIWDIYVCLPPLYKPSTSMQFKRSQRRRQ